MRVTIAEVLQSYVPWPGVLGMTLHGDHLGDVLPGQCLLLRAPTYSGGIFAQPIFPSARNDDQSTIDVLARMPGDQRTFAWLSEASGNAFAYGPVGRPFSIDRKARHVLLVDGGSPVTPLLYLAQQLVAQGNEVTYLAAARASDTRISVALPPEIELRNLNQHSSESYGATLAAAMGPLASWADAMYLALESWQIPLVSTILRRHLLHLRKGFAQVLLEPRYLPCGIGACDLCAIKLRDGYKRHCRDGLTFDLLSFL